MKGWMIFILAVVLYSVSVFGGFVWDDRRFVEFDESISKPISLIKVWQEPYFSMSEGLYRPLTKFSFVLNGFITGYNAWGFHLVNVILYGLVCVLVFEVLKKLKIKERTAFWLAIVFTVLPIHSEVVSNIVGRTEILALGFALLALYYYFENKGEKSALMLLFALLSKESAVVSIIILGYLVLVGKSDKSEKKKFLILYAIVFVLYLLMRLLVMGIEGYRYEVAFIENPLKMVTNGQRVMNAFGLVPLGLSKIILPYKLAFDYSFNQIRLATNWFDGRVILGIFSMLASLILVWQGLVRRNTPPAKGGLTRNDGLIIGMMFFWGPVLITGNFLFLAAGIFTERWYFWPSFGLILLFGSLKLPKIKDKYLLFGKALMILIIVLFGARTIARNLDWISESRLFVRDVRVVDKNYKAWLMAANVYIENKDFENTKIALEKAESIYSLDARLFNGWGRYYAMIGDYERARSSFQKCLEIEPKYAVCNSNMNKLP